VLFLGLDALGMEATSFFRLLPKQEYKKDIAYSPTRRVTPKILFTKKATQNCAAFVDLFLYEN
tara:strand:+ start:179 stop:367 length:189 start_codon:yes stop_codon:yes gene_type:complete